MASGRGDLLAEELDRAQAAGRLRIGAANQRPVRCQLCRLLKRAGEAWRLWIDGVLRGYICGGCWSW